MGGRDPRRADARTSSSTRKLTGGWDIVIVPALAAGPAAVLVGGRAGTVAGNLRRAGKEVWALVARGVLLPGALWDQLLSRALPLGLSLRSPPVS